VTHGHRLARVAARAICAAAVLLGGASPARAVTPPHANAPHNLHVAHARMVVEGNAIVARIRMFRDDLQRSLKRAVNDSAASKAAVAAYVAQNITLVSDGAKLSSEILDGGADMDGDQPIWWVLVQWKAPKPVQVLSLKVHLMFDTFTDQQNIVIVAKQPGDERHGLYFQAGDRSEQVLKF
jgi:hypothetical protein